MPSTAAFAAARTIIGTDVLGAPVVYPNEELQSPDDTDLYIQVTGAAGSGDPGEVGPNPFWSEYGTIECFILARVGTGSDEARAVRDALMARFRDAVTQPATRYVRWLSYDDAEGEDQPERNAAWWPMTLRVRYGLED